MQCTKFEIYPEEMREYNYSDGFLIELDLNNDEYMFIKNFLKNNSEATRLDLIEEEQRIKLFVFPIDDWGMTEEVIEEINGFEARWEYENSKREIKLTKIAIKELNEELSQRTEQNYNQKNEIKRLQDEVKRLSDEIEEIKEGQ